MQIEIRLSKLLCEHGLDKRGVLQRIARECKVHRHTVGKLYRNELKNPSLSVLGRICDWLESNGVPGNVLPEALFGSPSTGLWQAIAQPGLVRIYVGEYRQQDADTGGTRRWVALRDSVDLTGFARRLSSQIEMERARPKVETEYVPFQFSRAAQGGEYREEREAAKRVFKEIQSRRVSQTTILIGSQRANYLAEYLVADLFGCRAFHAPSGRTPRVPFYTAYRAVDRPVPSCFGGTEPPIEERRTCTPGVYYLDKKKEWQLAQWEDDVHDAGVLITVHYPATTSLIIAAFGFSGRSTASIGREMLEQADDFWPPSVKVNGKEVGVFVCRFTFKPNTQTGNSVGPEIDEFEVVPLSANVLEDCLVKKRKRR